MSKDIVSNKKAFFNYEISDQYEAGLVLVGTEVKSLRDHGGNISEAYVRLIKGEMWLVNSNIAHYKFGNINNHVERRDRKLLMHKKEINKLSKFLLQKGFSVVPLSIFLKNGFFKIRIGCARGKRMHDKRQTIISREKDRELAAAIKQHRI